MREHEVTKGLNSGFVGGNNEILAGQTGALWTLICERWLQAMREAGERYAPETGNETRATEISLAARG